VQRAARPCRQRSYNAFGGLERTGISVDGCQEKSFRGIYYRSVTFPLSQTAITFLTLAPACSTAHGSAWAADMQRSDIYVACVAMMTGKPKVVHLDLS